MATDCISSNRMLKNRAVWNRTKSGYMKAARPADLGLSTGGIFFDGARERHRRNYTVPIAGIYTAKLNHRGHNTQSHNQNLFTTEATEEHEGRPKSNLTAEAAEVRREEFD